MKTKLGKRINLLIRLAIIIATYSFLYVELFHKRNLETAFQNLVINLNDPGFIKGLIAVFLLMLLNWGVEARKWQYQIAKIENTRFLRAYKAVLTGISVSAFMPNRMGDYFGRVFILKKANHIEGILITVVGSISQLATTIIFGSIGLLVFLPMIMDPNDILYDYMFYGLLVASVAGITILLLFYFNISVLTVFLQKFTKKRWEKLRDHLRAFSFFNQKELLVILLFSVLRYLVFTFQFYLLFILFGVDMSFFHAIIMTSVIFLFITAIPTVALSEIGVRGSVAIYVAGLYFGQNGILPDNITPGVFSAATVLWFFNIVIPAITGTLFVFNLKFFRKNNN